MLIQVLRLEKDDQTGVFRMGIFSAAVNHSASCKAHYKARPMPRRDGMQTLIENHYGFHNAKEMRDWFPIKDDDHLLSEQGIAVTTYEIDDSLVEHGRSQLSFPIASARKVDRQPLENY